LHYILSREFFDFSKKGQVERINATKRGNKNPMEHAIMVVTIQTQGANHGTRRVYHKRTKERKTIKERNIIKFLWKRKGKKKRAAWSEYWIAALLGVHRSTISREIKRGRLLRANDEPPSAVPAYSASLAQIRADAQKEQHGPPEKIGKDHKLAATIAKMIKEEQYSPYAIGAKFEHERGWPTDTRISDKTIYHYHRDKGIITACTRADLRCGGKRLRKRQEGLKRRG
jgi:IS30 family transposase